MNKDSVALRLRAKVFRHLIPSRFQPSSYIHGLAASRTHATVQNGPFRGMRYIDQSFCSSIVPKWLGIYERELAACIEEAITIPFQTVVDIGAAEGYYAVGLALRTRAQIIAFEMDTSARKLMKSMVALNRVEGRVAIEGKCTQLGLREALASSGMTMVLCDAEGAEAILLDPIRVPELKECHILVELHDFVIGGLSEAIRDRFSASHNITHVWQECRDRSEFPYRSLYTKLFPNSIDLGLSEGRPSKMAWYWMRPHEEAPAR